MSSLERFKQVQQEYNDAVSKEKELQVELNMLKKQSIEILKSYGYTSFNDINKLKSSIADLEKEMEDAITNMEEYIAYVNKKKEEKDSILVG